MTGDPDHVRPRTNHPRALDPHPAALPGPIPRHPDVLPAGSGDQRFAARGRRRVRDDNRSRRWRHRRRLQHDHRRGLHYWRRRPADHDGRRWRRDHHWRALHVDVPMFNTPGQEAEHYSPSTQREYRLFHTWRLDETPFSHVHPAHVAVVQAHNGALAGAEGRRKAGVQRGSSLSSHSIRLACGPTPGG